MENLDPSFFFANSVAPFQKHDQLNQSTTPTNTKLSKNAAKSLLKSKKTSSLIIDTLDESSILFNSEIGNPSDSVVMIDLSKIKESPTNLSNKAQNRRETLKIFRKNREMAKHEENLKKEEVHIPFDLIKGSKIYDGGR